MYVAQLGWLHATPRVAGKAGSTSLGRSSRMKALHEEGALIRMPPLNPGAYLFGWLLELGFVSRGGSGEVQPLTFTELKSWAELTGRLYIQPWEVKALRNLSNAYVVAYLEGQDPNAPPPWVPPADERNRENVARRLSAAFSARARSPAGAKR